MEFFKPGRVFDFMGWRRIAFTISTVLIVLSAVLMVYPGPNYGTDFRGGTEVEIAFKQDIDIGRVRDAVESSGFKTPDVVQVASSTNKSQFLIRVPDVTVVDDDAKKALTHALCHFGETETVDEARCPPNARATEVKFSLGGDKIATRYDVEPDLEKIKEQVGTVGAVKLRVSSTNPQVVNPRDHRVEIQLQSKGDQLIDALRSKLGDEIVPEKPLRVEWVGPRAGKQLRDSARNSIVIAAVLIMVYLSFRFDLRFAPGVIVASIHDAFIVIGAFVLLKKEVTLSTIAAILTVVGYSMNDTVVVYDRIRENLSKYRGQTFGKVINMSVSETLSRTILTSGATMLSMAAFFVWGTGVIKDFALALFIGIIVGTYSSVYVAAPLTEWIDSRMKKQAARATAPERRAPAKA